MVEYVRTRPTLHDHWPEPDRSAWQIAMRIGDDFTAPGSGAGWSPRSRENVERAYDIYLGTLRDHGILESVTSVADRYDLAAIKLFYEDRLTKVRSSSAWANLQALSRAFAAMAPETDRRDLHAVLSRLKARTSLVRSFKQPLPRPSDLVEIGNSLMTCADGMRLGFKAAIKFRDGALIKAATLIPLRRANWASVSIGRELVLDKVSVTLRIAAVQTKSRRQSVEIRLPLDVAASIRHYIDVYRPVLAKPNVDDRDGLWLSQTGEPLTRAGVGLAISRSLEQRLGRPFSTHMFRHVAASFVADIAPDQSRMIAGFLTHATEEVAEEHYIRGQRAAAMREFQQLVREVIVSAGC